MILRATVPPRPLADVDKTWCVEPDFEWNGETTGSSIEMRAAQFVEKLRSVLGVELHTARLSWGGDDRERVSRTPRFRNQAALTIWLDEQIREGSEIVELTDFPCVVEYADYLNDLIFPGPWGLSHGSWSTCLANARCPVCGIIYGTSDLREIEYDVFFHGEYVLVCPREDHLFILGSEAYQLGG